MTHLSPANILAPVSSPDYGFSENYHRQHLFGKRHCEAPAIPFSTVQELFMTLALWCAVCWDPEVNVKIRMVPELKVISLKVMIQGHGALGRIRDPEEVIS